MKLALFVILALLVGVRAFLSMAGEPATKQPIAFSHNEKGLLSFSSAVPALVTEVGERDPSAHVHP